MSDERKIPVIPMIALNCDVFPVVEADDLPARQRAGVWLEYVDTFTRRGACPIVVPPGASPAALDRVDGVVLIGSDDYRLGNPDGIPENFVAVDRRREEADVSLARVALDRDLPLLAICGGFQLVTLVAGGTIHGDLPSEMPSDVEHSSERTDAKLSTHEVDWRGDPRFAFASPGRYLVNTQHHQAVCTLPEGWSTSATAKDGVIEAAFGPGRFQCGVQWHPERDAGELSEAILAAFVEASLEHRSERVLGA